VSEQINDPFLSMKVGSTKASNFIHYNLTKIFSMLVFGIGIIVLIGWFTDIDILKSLLPTWVTMKFATALSFVMSGVILYCMNESIRKNSEYAKMFLLAPMIVILFFMVTLLVSTIAGISTGIQDIFIKEEIGAIKSVAPGIPSIGTMINFLLVYTAGIILLLNFVKQKKILSLFASLITIIGGLAIFGYATGMEIFYYTIEGFSTAMALHTAIAFMLIGVGMFFLAKGNKTKKVIPSHYLTIREKIVIIFLPATVAILILMLAIHYSFTQQEITQKTIEQIRYLQIPVVISILSLVIHASLFLSNSISVPIKELKDKVNSIAGEKYNVHNGHKIKDEIIELTMTFEEMRLQGAKQTQKLVSSEQKFRDLYENSPNLLRTIDINGKILDCNERYAQTLGYTKMEVISSSIFNHVPKDKHDVMKKSFEGWKKIGRVGGREVTLLRKDGTTFPALLTASGIYNAKGDLVGSNTSIINLTEINKIRKQVQEEKIKRLTAIGELSARIAHDLRNPMSVIKNTLELLKMELDVKHNEKIQNKFERIDRAVIRINHQVENVLDFIRSKPLQFENTSLSSILNYVIDKINIPSDVTINLPKNDVKVFCDFEKLEIVFINLITNSIQAMANTGEINIRCIDEESQIIIEIEDFGPGISEENLSKIFDPLFTTRQIGTGLGLPSCKNIVEKHGGTIEVKSRIDEGTTFVIKLPKKLNLVTVDAK